MVYPSARCQHHSWVPALWQRNPQRRLFGWRPPVHNARMPFQDHFSVQAGAYARFRPIYPEALFTWLAQQLQARQLAWDCATGNGQAALGLTAHFAQVVASDASPEQLLRSREHPQIRYFVTKAEVPPAEAQGADLVTVAQALHWFNFERFYPALKRTLKPGGLFAAWGYGLMRITPAVDAVVQDYYSNIVGAYWPAERNHIETAYREIPFPLTEIVPPSFVMQAEWSLETLLGYLETWSATRLYRQAREGADPVEALRASFARACSSSPGVLAARVTSWSASIR